MAKTIVNQLLDDIMFTKELIAKYKSKFDKYCHDEHLRSLYSEKIKEKEKLLSEQRTELHPLIK